LTSLPHDDGAGGPGWTALGNTFEHLRAHSFFNGSIWYSADGSLALVDVNAREVELPRGSAVFEHFAATAAAGGIVYLTRHGRRVAAVVPSDVAEALEQAEPDQDPQAALQELLDEAEARVGPVPPEIAAEVDRQWAAAVNL
jgi:hypothetical protein